MAIEARGEWTLIQHWGEHWLLYGGKFDSKQEAERACAAIQTTTDVPIRVCNRDMFNLEHDKRKALLIGRITENPTYQQYSLLVRSLSRALAAHMTMVELEWLVNVIEQKLVQPAPELTPVQKHADELLESLELVLIYMGDYGTREDHDDENFVRAQKAVRAAKGL